MKWKRVTIVGCGLIGASFAMALRQADACERIAGWDTDAAALDEAIARNVIDEVDVAIGNKLVSDSELIYLATPIDAILRFLRESGASLKDGAIVTDAGSTKKLINDAARAHLPKNCFFIGGHPIAGSHLSGLAHAHPFLFKDAPYVLTIDKVAKNDFAFIRVKETIEMTRARLVLMTADEHDHALALVSHLPQLVSSALAATIAAQPNAHELTNLAGTGYKDMTRLAASSWSIWQDILRTNSISIADALDLFIAKLTTIREDLRHNAAHPAANSKTSELFRQ